MGFLLGDGGGVLCILCLAYRVQIGNWPSPMQCVSFFEGGEVIWGWEAEVKIQFKVKRIN